MADVDYFGDLKRARAISYCAGWDADHDSPMFIGWLKPRGMLMVSFTPSNVVSSLSFHNRLDLSLTAVGLDLRHSLALLVALVAESEAP